MIHSITVTNQLGESIEIELKRPEKSGFIVLDADELLEPVKATINTSRVATLNGTVYNSSYLGQRSMVINLRFMEVWEETGNGLRIKETIEDIRLKSYKYFPECKQIKLVIKTDKYTVETNGYVEHNKPNVFSENEGSSISIICTDPYLYSIDTEYVTLSGVVPKFSFPFSNKSNTESTLIFGKIENKADEVIYYDGQGDAGMVIRIHAVGEFTNLTLHNATYREKMQIDTTKLAILTGQGITIGDTIVVDTRPRHKSITLIREGIRTDIINCLQRGTAWLTLRKGDNVIAYRAASGGENVRLSVEYKNAYEGV